MKSRLLLVVALSVLGSFLLVSTASAQAPASATADATAEIVANIAIAQAADLNFGQIVPSGAVGSVSVDVNTGNGSDAGGVTLVNNGLIARAEFDVSGMLDATYAITLPASCALTGPGLNMLADTFEDSLGGTGTLDAVTGTQSFFVGATLHVNANQAPGDYSGTFAVAVNYN